MRRHTTLRIVSAFACAAALLAACFPAYDFATGGDGGGSDAAADGTLPVGAPAPGADDASHADGGGTSADAQDELAFPDTGPFDASGVTRIDGGSITVQGQPETLTHAFYIDTYEVTVRRFKAWVNAGSPPPCASGTCSLDVPGGPYAARMQWDAAWNTAELFTRAGYADGSCIAGNGGPPVMTFTRGDDLPINCVTWYQAQAFCFWEGGKRLPTWVEWTVAASGRGGARTYPWGSAAPDCAHAIFDSTGDGGGCGLPARVGTATAGASPDGVLDLGGNVYERTYDFLGVSGLVPSGKTDFVGPACEAGVTAYEECTTARGGGWNGPAGDVANSYSRAIDKGEMYDGTGFRCARTVP